MTPALTPEEKRTLGELYLAAYAEGHPRDPADSPFVYYARSLEWLGTPEGMTAYRAALRTALTPQP